MSFLWCPFCRNPHLLSETICPITGSPLEKRRKHSVQVGALVQGKYRLGRRLGQGAFGVVYAAQNVALGGEVALKFLGKQSARAAARFDQEARIANALGHPNICRVFDSGATSGGTPFFVMELLQGQTLAERMAHSILDPAEAGAIMSQVLSGLGAAHAKGIVHRDIKPENIFLEDREGLDPIAKILDFGLAKQTDRNVTNGSTGLAVGTVLYMAPEQLAGETPTPQWDVWAAGVVLYQALSGRHPFSAPKPMEVAARIMRDSPRPLTELVRECPRRLAAAVGKALEKNPSTRFRTARELQAALHEALGVRERSPAKGFGRGPSGLPRLASSDSDNSPIPRVLVHESDDDDDTETLQRVTLADDAVTILERGISSEDDTTTNHIIRKR